MMQTMKRVMSLAIAAAVLAGCGEPARKLTDPKELAAVQAAEVARVNYEFHLAVLGDRMQAVGDLRRERWAQRELKNIRDSHKLEWIGLGKILPPDRATLGEADRALLVEYVVAARGTYLKAMDGLLALYQGAQDRPGVERVQGVLDAFNPIRTYMYFLSVEIPAENLRAEEEIPAATGLFDKALRTYDDSKKPWVVGNARRTAHVHAIRDFREVIAKYPKSNKISRCAFFIAELYRTYEEYERSVVWYDRAWQWDPRTPDPVRYNAALLYDFKLKNAKKALKYYELALKHDRNRDNVNYARERIKVLKKRVKNR